MTHPYLQPFAQALRDYSTGDASAQFIIERSDGCKFHETASVFFRKPSEFLNHEKTALDLCRGRILDVGAGAGVHSLYLQEKGHAVTAMDVLPEAVDIMSRAGVKDVRCADVWRLEAGPFDTILMLGRNVGLVGDLSGLDQFLVSVKRLLKNDGQILLNSCDISKSDDSDHLAYQQSNRDAGRYFGEIKLRFHYKDISGDWFKWLHIDPATLKRHADNAGWTTDFVSQEDDGNYLAQLTLKTAG